MATAVCSLPGSALGAELPLGPRSLEERRASAEVAPGVRWTRIVREGGPWRVNVLAVSGGARAVVAAGRRVGQRTRTSTLARRARALAAVNGGYFAADGNPAGVVAAGGALLSEPVGGRTALLLDDTPALAALRFEGEVSAGGRSRLLDGVNRAPGYVPACGGRGGDEPTEHPDAATTCTDPSELVAFTPAWGRRTVAAGRAPLPRAASADAPSTRPLGRIEATVRDGVVTALRRSPGAAIPREGFVLAGTRDAATFLRRFAGVGTPVELDLGLRAGRSPLSAGAAIGGIVGGGPRLVGHSRIRVRASAEGFAPLSAPSFYGAFVTARHPRTLAGVRADGTLLLVTVDGRRPGWSAGVTLPEAGRVMRSLGAREAVNLDGGGSTTMSVRGRVVNRPSDTTGERPVSDALLVLPTATH